MRLLACGSRTLANPYAVSAILSGFWVEASRRGEQFTLIEGHAPSGADAHAAEWARVHSTYVDHLPFPADWDAPCVLADDELRLCQPGHRRARPNGTTYCPTQGFRRNQRMLDDGKPQLVVAFVDVDKPLGMSRGTSDLVARAKIAGVPHLVVMEYYAAT